MPVKENTEVGVLLVKLFLDCICPHLRVRRLICYELGGVRRRRRRVKISFPFSAACCPLVQ